MIITCPHCQTKYQVAYEAIGSAGRKVQCAQCRQAWQQPGALTGMLNWYRAPRFRPSMKERITTPTLVLWGMQDHALEGGLAERSLSFCNIGRLQPFERAMHWVQREEASAVNAALLTFLDG